jgi:hypothetical protein
MSYHSSAEWLRGIVFIPNLNKKLSRISSLEFPCYVGMTLNIRLSSCCGNMVLEPCCLVDPSVGSHHREVELEV